MGTLDIDFAPSDQQENGFDLDLALTLPTQGVTALFGHSGSGKTTLLRLLAGLEKRQSGKVAFNGQVWQNHNTFLPTHQRPIGFVFQEASLFPHLTAQGNLAFAQKRAGNTPRLIDYDDVVALMGIAPLLQKYPHQLSGGERQRIAIARALLIQPQLLLMDEPLSALDAGLKQEILPYLDSLCAHMAVPIIYVSHALEEIIRLANHTVIIEQGKIIDQGETQSLLGKLSTSHYLPYDASVLVAGSIVEKNEAWGLATLQFGEHRMVIQQSNTQIGDTLRLQIQARDVSIALTCDESSSILNRLAVSIDSLSEERTDPHRILVRMMAGSTPILASITAFSAHKLDLKPGQHVFAQIKSVAVVRPDTALKSL